ncbi:MAG: polysaccharide biosynthesis tyrosine autokinase [Microbacterium sp.]
MTVLDLMTLLRRGWRILAVAVVVGVLAGLAYGILAPKVYESRATGFISATGSSVVAGSDEAVARAGAYMVLIDSTRVRDTIAEDAGITPSQLAGSLRARVVPGSNLVEVTASAANPKDALKLANGALDALAKVVTEIQTEAGATDKDAAISISPMDTAVAPTAPASPNRKLAVGLGALAGLVLGVIVVLLRKALDVRVRTHTDIAALAGAGVLGRVPKVDLDGTSKKDVLARAVASEAYRQIRTGLRFSSVDHEVRVVMVTSANQGEGKSVTARSIARVMAESGQRTLIVDGDLRRPTVAKGFEIDGTIGLSEVLSGQIAAPAAIRPAAEQNLFVLPAGGIPPNPSEMLGSSTLQQLLAEFRRDFFVIIDAPPVLPVTDASVLSTIVDGVVFVTAIGRTRKTEVAEARALLDQVRARVLGVVLNLVSLRGGENGVGYYRQNSKYYVLPDAAEPKADRPEKSPRPLKPAKAPRTAPGPQRSAPVAPAPAEPEPVTDGMSVFDGLAESEPVDVQQALFGEQADQHPPRHAATGTRNARRNTRQ